MKNYQKLALFVLGLLGIFTSVAAAENYAIIFAGGASANSNWPRYYNNVIRYYDILTLDLNYRPENVWVITSDGLDPGNDRNDGTSEDPILHNSDYSAITARGSTVLSATGVNLQNTLNNLDLGAEDFFHLWSFDHGGGTDPNPDGGNPSAPTIFGEEVLWGWGQSISDENLASWCNGINAGREVYVFGQCFAGGMLDNFNIGSSESGRFGASATNHYESSYGDGFVREWADSIDAGKTLTGQLFADALANDPFRPSGTWADNEGTWTDGKEHPWSVGNDNIDIAVAKYQGKGTGVYATHLWNTAQNWTYQPNYDRSVRIEFTSFTGDVLVNSAGCSAGYLTADWSSAIGSDGYLQIVTGGALTSRYQVIGEERYGKVLHDGGTNTVNNDLTIARRSGSIGYYTQNGGTNTVNGKLYVGRESGATGHYFLTDGTLNANNMNVGHAGTGYLTLTTGTCAVSGTLSLGEESGGWGSVTQNGAAVSADYEYIGRYGTGYYTQAGGTNTVANRAYLGRYASGYGVYNLNGGTLSTDELLVGYLGGTGYLNLRDGTLAANSVTINTNGTMRTFRNWTFDGDLNLYGKLDATYWEPYDVTFQAASGSADAFIYTGGLLNAKNLSVGYNTSRTGSLTQSNGTVNCDYLYTGAYGTGTYTQTGGTTNVAEFLYVGRNNGTGNGTYALSNTANLNAKSEFIGFDATGVFNQTGGTNTIANQLYMGYSATNGGNGTYNLSGGTLSATNEYLGYNGSATFNHSGGTNSLTNGVYLGINSTAQGTYTLSSSGTLNTPTLYCGYSSGGTGIFNYNGGTLNTDTINIVNAASKFNQLSFDWSFDGHIQIDGGTYDATGRSLTLDANSTATLDMTGGQLKANYLRVGYNESGEVTQSSGTATVTNDLYMGGAYGKSGSYSLSGGTLNSNHVRAGYFGNGTFTQTGGTHNASFSVILGYQSTGYGQYALSGGTLATHLLYVGYNGGAIFNYTGGTLDVDSTYVYSDGSLQFGLDWTCDGLLYINGGNVNFSLSGTPEEFKLDNAASAATCTMTSGSLNSSHQWIGVSGLGKFTQSGGTNTLSTLFLGTNNGSQGTYALSNGTVNAGRTMVGYHGQGTLSVSNGSFNSPQYVYVGRYTDGEGTLNLTGGTLTTNNLVVGYEGAGTMNYSAGSLNAESITVNPTGVMNVETNWTRTKPVYVAGGSLDAAGYNLTLDGTTASLSITNGGTVSATNLSAGETMSGQVIQTDGTLTAANYLYVGNQTGSTGSYQIDAGAASCQHLRVGYYGTGTITQNGGSVSATNNTYLGVFTGGQGTYTLNAGSFATPALTIGLGNSGIFDYYDGTLSIDEISIRSNGQFNTHKNLNCTANVTLSGGSIDTNGTNLTIYGSRTWAMNSGTIDANTLSLAYAGSSTMTQESGTVTAATLYQGYFYRNAGSYTFSGGSINTQDHIIGNSGSGTFIQSRGDNTAANSLVLGANANSFGSYSISGGSLTAGDLQIGQSGHGEFHIAGASANLTVTNRLTFGTDSLLSAVPGSTIHMTGSAFSIENTDPADLDNLRNLTLIFEGGSRDIDPFETPSRDLGRTMNGYCRNFSLDTLQLGGADIGMIQLGDLFDNNPAWTGSEAVYVETLILGSGSTLDLGGLNLYYLNFTDDGGSILTGGGKVRQINYLPGDANEDGTVDVGDLGILAANYGLLSDALWSLGDFNFDGNVDVGDLGILAANYGTSLSAAIPEPTCLFLLGLGSMLLRRRR